MPVADLPQNADVLAAAFGAEVRGENEPLRVPDNGGYVWFDVDWDHAGARPAARRGQGQGRGALARRRDRRPASRPRPPRCWTSSRPARSFADVAAADKLKVEWRPGIKRSGPPAGLSPAAVERDFQDAARMAPAASKARAPTERDRVPRHRDQGAAARSASRPTPSASTRRCRAALHRRFDRAIHRAAAEATSASPSIRAR